jgi:quercetin dioxygenase-like cupin family protein
MSKTSAMPAALAMDLARLIEYQEGSVVSRTLIGKKAATVTLFAFAGGEGLSEHTAPYDALVQVLEGQAQIAIEGEKHRLGPGQAMLMPAHKPHALQALEDFKMLLVMVKA